VQRSGLHGYVSSFMQQKNNHVNLHPCLAGLDCQKKKTSSQSL
jgi:hypothetical protein